MPETLIILGFLYFHLIREFRIGEILTETEIKDIIKWGKFRRYR